MPTGPALATLEEFAAYLQVDAADLEPFGEALLASVSDLVRNRGLDQRIDLVEDDVEVFYGTGNGVLLLTELPAIEVTEVALEDGDGVLGDPLTPGTEYRFEAGRDGARGILRRRPSGRVWVKGEPVHVTYSHGYRLAAPGSGDSDLDAPLLPPDLKLIVFRIAARGVINPASLTQQSIGQANQSFGMDPGRVATLTSADLADLAPFLAASASGSR